MSRLIPRLELLLAEIVLLLQGEQHLLAEQVLLDGSTRIRMIRILRVGRCRQQRQQCDDDAHRDKPAHLAGSQQGEKNVPHNVPSYNGVPD